MPKPSSIPELGLIGCGDLCTRLGVSYTTFNKLRVHPEFPQPILLGPKSMKFWREVDIKKFIKKLRG
jgi:predicted DNA-binding transcriptional regulator AlpA